MLTYDAMGNPLTYFNGKKSWNFTWKYGRQLASAADGTHTITNTYDVDGVRESKTVDGVEHKYVTLDGKIIRETYGTVTVNYFYDNEGKPYKLTVDEDNSTSGGYYTGYFVLNQQGDVIAILNANGAKAVSYEYNAWGQILSEDATTEVAGALFLKYNALKYRGYYYDAETGFYYVSSRYYDPVIGRFINADDDNVLSLEQGSLLQYNLYTYCLNNPVNRVDIDGYFSISNLGKIGIGAAFIAVGIAATVLSGGTAIPALIAGVKTAVTIGAISAATSGGITAISSTLSGDNAKTVLKKTIKSSIDGFCDGFMAGGITAGASMTTGALIKNSSGIKIGNTPNPNHGRVDIGYGSSSKNGGGTLLSYNNKNGSSRFRIDADSLNTLHLHYGQTNRLRKIHRTGLIRSIIGGLTGAWSSRK